MVTAQMRKQISLAMVLLLVLVAVVFWTMESSIPVSGDLQLVDGEYEGVGKGFLSEIRVGVTVIDQEITEIIILSHQDTPGIADLAIQQIPERIIQSGGLDVDVVTQATYTSDGIINAVRNALGLDQ